jgi:NRPS condensation-like uncharacterized protein
VDAGVFNRSTFTLEQYAKMLIKYVIIHEVGHMLGLHHTNQPDNLDRYQVVPLVKSNGNDNPSIMMQVSTEYFKALSQRLGRAITINDIVLSNNDKLAVKYQWMDVSFRSMTSLIDNEEL